MLPEDAGSYGASSERAQHPLRCKRSLAQAHSDRIEDGAFCKEGSSHPSAKLFPLNTSGRQYSVYDQSTKKFTTVNTCFGTFHLNFAHDADNTLWSGRRRTAMLSLYVRRRAAPPL